MKRETSVHLYLSLESGTATCVAERVYACLAAWRATCAARDFDLGGGFQHSGNYPMVFLHSGLTSAQVSRPGTQPANPNAA